jgi:hypothetical protein
MSFLVSRQKVAKGITINNILQIESETTKIMERTYIQEYRNTKHSLK